MTLVLVAATTSLRVAMNPFLGDSAPYAFQAVAALAVSALAGLRPGLFGIVVAVTIGWFVVPPYDLPLHQMIANETITLLVGSLICLVTATMRDALIASARSQREADFISREMHHRVKNLFAVVSSLSTLAARERPEAQQALGELRQRVQALSQAHDVAISEVTIVTLKDLMDRLVAPYRKPVSGDARVILSGDEVVIPYGCLTPLGLIFHELATNAVKYGALATPAGQVHVSWRVRDDTLEITWQETGAENCPEEGKPGFGTVLVEASVAQMRGSMVRERKSRGICIRLSMPLRQDTGNEFQSSRAGDSQLSWETSRSSLSALPASKSFSQKRLVATDLQS